MLIIALEPPDSSGRGRDGPCAPHAAGAVAEFPAAAGPGRPGAAEC